MNVGERFEHYRWKMVFTSYWVMSNIALNGPKTTVRTHFFQILWEGGLDFDLAFNGIFINHNELSHYQVPHKIEGGVFTLVTCE